MTYPELFAMLGRLALVVDAIREPITLKDLAEKAGHSVDTVTRDIDALQELGAPIIWIANGGKVRLARRWGFWRVLREASLAAGAVRAD